jgi:hypothetical protein
LLLFRFLLVNALDQVNHISGVILFLFQFTGVLIEEWKVIFEPINYVFFLINDNQS